MSLTNPNIPYMLKVSWMDNQVPKEQILDTRAAGFLLYQLELQKGIKGKFILLD